MTNNNNKILCPSAQCKEKSIILGRVQKNGHIAFLSEKIEVDKTFVEIAHLGHKPEKKFRFADDCMTSNCKFWHSGKCNVIDILMIIFASKQNDDQPMKELPNCSIRSECRWYKQVGEKACKICPKIITDISIE